jgi:glutaredoxin
VGKAGEEERVMRGESKRRVESGRIRGGGAEGVRAVVDVQTGMSDDPRITLYRLQACPYCERVVRTLDELGLAYRSRFVEPMHSERNVVRRISGTRTVPAIVDEETGVTMSESANIVDYLRATYGDAGGGAGRERAGAGAEAGGDG